MNATELAALAVATLNAQQRYFKDRRQEDLIASKALEQKLRHESEAILKVQGNLFSNAKG